MRVDGSSSCSQSHPSKCYAGPGECSSSASKCYAGPGECSSSASFCLHDHDCHNHRHRHQLCGFSCCSGIGSACHGSSDRGRTYFDCHLSLPRVQPPDNHRSWSNGLFRRASYIYLHHILPCWSMYCWRSDYYRHCTMHPELHVNHHLRVWQHLHRQWPGYHAYFHKHHLRYSFDHLSFCWCLHAWRYDDQSRVGSAG